MKCKDKERKLKSFVFLRFSKGRLFLYLRMKNEIPREVEQRHPFARHWEKHWRKRYSEYTDPSLGKSLSEGHAKKKPSKNRWFYWL